jgi:tetratricopeptide (TPR) repeat protein
LRRAKEFFDKGEFGEARAVLETELEQMQDEQTWLLVKRDEYETDILPKLKSNAEQFFFLALLTQLNKADANWFADTCEYYERSIKSYPTKNNVFHYAVFSWQHNRVAEAEKYYQKYLSDFASEISFAEKAGALNNLGLLHWDSNEYTKGLAECEEALSLYKNLSKGDPSTYLPEVAGTLNNIAMFHGELNESSKSLKEYKEALGIYRGLSENISSDYLFDVAKILSNLGSINTQRKNYKKALAELEESIRIFKQLAKLHSSEYPFYIATSLHNLGVLHGAKKDYEKAIEAYEEALSIRMNSAKTNPSVYLPEASCTLSNLSFLYIKYVPNREKSIEYALETIAVLLPIYEQVPFTQRYLQTAINVLKGWDLSDEEIENMIEGKMMDQ